MIASEQQKMVHVFPYTETFMHDGFDFECKFRLECIRRYSH